MCSNTSYTVIIYNLLLTFDSFLLVISYLDFGGSAPLHGWSGRANTVSWSYSRVVSHLVQKSVSYRQTDWWVQSISDWVSAMIAELVGNQLWNNVYFSQKCPLKVYSSFLKDMKDWKIYTWNISREIYWNKHLKSEIYLKYTLWNISKIYERYLKYLKYFIYFRYLSYISDIFHIYFRYLSAISQSIFQVSFTFHVFIPIYFTRNISRIFHVSFNISYLSRTNFTPLDAGIKFPPEDPPTQ